MTTEMNTPNLNETPFEEITIKKEPDCVQGSTSSLLSIHSTVLQSDIPKMCLYKNETDLEGIGPKEEFIKTEPLYLDLNEKKVIIKSVETSLLKNNSSEDEIELKKRQIIENETTVYKCKSCERTFPKFAEFKLHQMQHSIERRTCTICNFLCQGITKLREHMNRHTGKRPFKCPKCKKGFASAHVLKGHMESHLNEYKFECDKCGKLFKTKRSLRGHGDTHAEKVKDYVCNICNKEFLTLGEYKVHLKAHGAKLPEPKCYMCNKVLSTEAALKSHLSTHVDLKFPCHYCDKIFTTSIKARKHINRSHVKNECELCKMVFYDKTEFAKHKKSEHAEEKPIICKICQKIFDKVKNLKEHVRMQHTEDGLENKCEHCDKNFINRFLLNNHVKTHSKDFKCPSCNMTFSSRYNLQLHSVTHTNERRFKCNMCEKDYTSKAGLQTHVATHFDDKPFECGQCGKRFKSNRRLYVHKVAHETDLKFECFNCGNKFKSKQYLRAHMYKHEKVKPYECPDCPKKFKHKKTQEAHILTKHVKSPENTIKKEKIDIIDDSDNESVPSDDQEHVNRCEDQEIHESKPDDICALNFVQVKVEANF